MNLSGHALYDCSVDQTYGILKYEHGFKMNIFLYVCTCSYNKNSLLKTIYCTEIKSSACIDGNRMLGKHF